MRHKLRFVEDPRRNVIEAHPSASEGKLGVSALLRASRLRCGEELEDISRSLRISVRYLQAMEEGRFRDLPGHAYAVGFVRVYAQHLGLDSQEVVRRFKSESMNASEKTHLNFPTPIPEAGVPRGAVVFVGLVVAVLAYGGWYVSTLKQGFFSEVVAPIPERLLALVMGERRGESEETAAENRAAETPSPTTATAAIRSNEPFIRPDAEAGAKPPVPAPAPAGETAAEPGRSAPEAAPTTPATAAAPSAASPSQPEAAPRSAAETASRPIKDKPAVDRAPAAGIAAAPGTAAAPSREAAAPPATPVRPPDPAQESDAEPARVAGTETRTPPAPASEPQPAASGSEARPRAAGAAEQGAAHPESAAPTDAERTPEAAPSGSARTDVAAASAGRATAPQEPGARVVITAKTNSWIQVRDDAANEMLLTRMLRAGDVYRVPNRPGLKLLTGDAGALEILVDGKPIPPLGAPGKVRRNVVLDAERLLSGTAVAD